MAQQLQYNEDQLAEVLAANAARGGAAAAVQEYKIHGKVFYDSNSNTETFSITVQVSPGEVHHFEGTATDVFMSEQEPETDINGMMKVLGSIHQERQIFTCAGSPNSLIITFSGATGPDKWLLASPVRGFDDFKFYPGIGTWA